MSRVANVLKAARAKIASEELWTKDTYARNRSGYPCVPTSPDAVVWCALGALYFISDSRWTMDKEAVRLLEEQLPREFKNIVRYNDYPDTKHEDVLDLYDRAIHTAKKAEVRQDE